MSAVDGRALVVYHGAGAVAVDVGGVVPGDGVPGHGQGLAGELERDSAADRCGGAVAGLPCAEDLLGVLDRDLSAPRMMHLNVAYRQIRG